MFSFKNIALCGAFGFALFGFVGCGDDSSTGASQNDISISSSNQIPTDGSISSSSEQSLAKSSASVKIEYGELTDERDGHTYKTVVIGTQTWMAENLNYADSVKTPSLKGHSWCYNNLDDKCKSLGRLYSWVAAIDSVKIYEETSQECGSVVICELLNDSTQVNVKIQGICPNGWHLPNYAEWQTLIRYVGGETSGRALKSNTQWDGLNTSGFSAIPSGINKSGLFNGVEQNTSFWSSSTIQNAYVDAIRMNLTDFDNLVSLKNESKLYGLSVRCIKD